MNKKKGRKVQRITNKQSLFPRLTVFAIFHLEFIFSFEREEQDMKSEKKKQWCKWQLER